MNPKTLTEAYEAVGTEPSTPIPEMPVSEASKARGYFAVYIDGPDAQSCEHAAEVIKGMILKHGNKLPNGCIADVDSGSLEYDEE